VSKQYGETISVCDLRWGIDTSEMSENESATKVLRVCLDEIDRSRPYMIVILGYRYGWMPGKERIETTIQGKKNIYLEDDDISVTALEIEYGAFLNADTISHTLFYFREMDGEINPIYQSEDELHLKKLNALKKRILSIPGSHVRTYHVHSDDSTKESWESFSAMVTEDLLKLLTEEWKTISTLDANAIDQKKQWDFLYEKNSQFVSRKAVSEECMTAICDAHQDVLLYGTAGSGKSTLLSHIGVMLHERKYHTVPIFCGHTPLCSSGFDILRYIVWELENALHLLNHFADAAAKDSYKLKDWNSYFDALCRQYDATADKELVFLIDGIDQLIQDETAHSFTFLKSENCVHIRFIVSAITSDRIPPLFCQIELGTLLPEERKDIIIGISSGKHREISDKVIELMLHRDASSSPLYLSLLVQRLVMMNHEDFQTISTMGDGMNAITEYQMNLLNACPDNPEDLSIYLLHQAATTIGGDTVLKAAELIALSRHGLRFSDLHGLMKQQNLEWNELNMAAFIQYMGFMFIYRSDGRYDFSHNSIRTGLLRHCSEMNRKHNEIGQWLYHLPVNDEVRLQEVLWHLSQADQKEEFAAAAIDMILKERENSEILHDMVSCVLEDEGAWMIETIKECAFMPAFPVLSGFLNQELFFAIPNTPKNLIIKMRICEMLYKVAQIRCSVQESDGAIWEITTIADRLAEVHYFFETNEHLEFSLKCIQQSLTLREKLLESIAYYDTPEKCQEYISNLETSSGIKTSRLPTSEECAVIVQSFRFQYQRGIGVAHRDMSKILISLKRYEEALKHTQEAIKMQEQMLHIYHNVVHMKGQNELLELAENYRTSSSLFQELGNLESAVDMCMRSLHYCEQVAKTEDSIELFEGLCDSKTSLAILYYQQHDTEKALALFLECLPVLEKIDAQVRTVQTQSNLEHLYHNISVLYRKLDGEENQKKADAFFQKSKLLSQSLSVRSPSIENIRNKLHITLDEVDEKIIQKTVKLDAETIRAMKVSFTDAMNLLEGMQSENAYNDVESVLLCATEILQKYSGLDNSSRERGIAELNILKYRLSIQYGFATHNEIRKMITQFSEISEKFSELETPKQYDTLLIAFLNVFGIRLDSSNADLSHEAASYAVQLSTQLAESTHELKDQDFLAVSLAKYCTSCLTHCPENFGKFNDQLFSISSQLYEQTENPKYAQMQFMAQIGRQYYQNTEKKENENTKDDIVDYTLRTLSLIEMIKKKEQEYSQLTGIVNSLKRKKVQKELNLLRKELEQLLNK
ncbi:MAG: DUF4062 domain-containing protein, partial [Oscillospiraceae bacterium]|nr:DUF4062 domain-containing protein [Oscillospiraceae bacterium]